MQIGKHLQPLDLLRLIRVSRHFRAIFTSKLSRRIWIAARANVEGLPDCPPDLSEPEYAFLVFDRDTCHVLYGTAVGIRPSVPVSKMSTIKLQSTNGICNARNHLGWSVQTSRA